MCQKAKGAQDSHGPVFLKQFLSFGGDFRCFVTQGGGLARDVFGSSGFIYKEYIRNPLTLSTRSVLDRHGLSSFQCTICVRLTRFYIEYIISYSTEVEIGR